MFKCPLLLALLGVACAFMGHMPSSTRSRGRVLASLADLEAKALSKPLSAKGPMAPAPSPVKQSGFSSFGSKSATPAPTTATKSTVVAKTIKPNTLKVTKEMANALSGPAAVVTKVKSVSAVEPSAPVVPATTGADFGTAGVLGGALLATIAGASAVSNALTGKAKAIADAEKKKAIEEAARQEFILRKQRARKPLAPGPPDPFRLAASFGLILASTGALGAFVLLPKPEEPAPIVKDIKKTPPKPPPPAPAAPAPKALVPVAAPTTKVEAKVEVPKESVNTPLAPKIKEVEPIKATAPVVEAAKPVEGAKPAAPTPTTPAPVAPVAEAPKPATAATPPPPPAAPTAPVVEAVKPASSPPSPAAKVVEKPKPAAAPAAKRAAAPVPAYFSVAGDAPSARTLAPDAAVDPEFLKALKGSKKGKK